MLRHPLRLPAGLAVLTIAEIKADEATLDEDSLWQLADSSTQQCEERCGAATR